MSNETKTHVIDGKTFVEVERKAKVGEKVITINYCGENTYEGAVETVERAPYDDGSLWTEGGAFFDTESGDKYFVLEPVDQAPDTTADLIANLIRRVHSLEQQLRDTQANIERQGVEIAEVANIAKSNEADIRDLDERTQTKVMLRSMTEFIERGLKERGVIR